MSKPSDLVQGTLDLLLLKILTLEPLNGFAISIRLKQVSGDVLKVSDGSLYPRFTSWSKKAGSKPSGGRARITAEQSFIRSRGWAAVSLGVKRTTGIASLPPSLKSSI